MPKKSMLLSLKKWLTVPEAARHLSNIFEEEVSESDVLRIALDGNLKISVYFVNHTMARCGKVVRYEETEWEESSLTTFMLSEEHLPDGVKGNREKTREYINQLPPTKVMKSLNLDGGRYLNLDERVISIDGVWDLPLGGGEGIDVEHEYQQLTDGPEVTLCNLDGAFVESEDGKTMCQLQESYEKIEYQSGSTAQLEMIKNRITRDSIDEEEASKLLEKHKKDRKVYLDKREKNPSDYYYPAGGLPHDSVLVVRTQALVDMQDRFLKEDSKNNAPIDKRSEKTYLNIIGAMLETFIHKDHGEVDFPIEAKLREFMAKKYDGFKGLAERTLAEKFAAAKRAINEDMDN